MMMMMEEEEDVEEEGALPSAAREREGAARGGFSPKEYTIKMGSPSHLLPLNGFFFSVLLLGLHSRVYPSTPPDLLIQNQAPL